MSRILSDATRAKLREAGRRSALARSVDLVVICDAIRATASMQAAAVRLGMTPKALSARLSRLQAAGSLPADVIAKRRSHAGRARVFTEAGRERLRAAGRQSPGRPLAYDRGETVAVLERTANRADAAVALGINVAALNKRVQWLRNHDALPDGLPALRRQPPRRRPAIRAPKPAAVQPSVARRPRRTYTAAQQPVCIPRWVPPVPAAPEPRREPVRVTVLPTPEWPAPTAPAPVDPFAERRQQLARQRHAQVWAERHTTGAYAPVRP